MVHITQSCKREKTGQTLSSQIIPHILPTWAISWVSIMRSWGIINVLFYVLWMDRATLRHASPIIHDHVLKANTYQWYGQSPIAWSILWERKHSSQPEDMWPWFTVPRASLWLSTESFCPYRYRSNRFIQNSQETWKRFKVVSCCSVILPVAFSVTHWLTGTGAI